MAILQVLLNVIWFFGAFSIILGIAVIFIIVMTIILLKPFFKKMEEKRFFRRMEKTR